MEQRYGTDPSRRYGTGVWNGCGPGACSGPPILTCPHIYIYILYVYCIYVYNIHFDNMHIEATTAGCRSFSLLIRAASLLYTCSTRFCLAWLVLVHAPGHNR